MWGTFAAGFKLQLRVEVSEEAATAQVLRSLVDEGITSVKTSLPSR